MLTQNRKNKIRAFKEWALRDELSVEALVQRLSPYGDRVLMHEADPRIVIVKEIEAAVVFRGSMAIKAILYERDKERIKEVLTEASEMSLDQKESLQRDWRARLNDHGEVYLQPQLGKSSLPAFLERDLIELTTAYFTATGTLPDHIEKRLDGQIGGGNHFDTAAGLRPNEIRQRATYDYSANTAEEVGTKLFLLNNKDRGFHVGNRSMAIFRGKHELIPLECAAYHTSYQGQRLMFLFEGSATIEPTYLKQAQDFMTQETTDETLEITRA